MMKEASGHAYTVMMTGLIPSGSWYASLNPLVNAVMLTPFPRAGPTGGAGVAFAGPDLQLNVASNFLCHDKCTSKNLW